MNSILNITIKETVLRNSAILLFFILGCMNIICAQNVTIDGLKYHLFSDTHEAMIDYGNTWSGELNLPSEVNYNGETYTVTGISWAAFEDCEELRKVRLPKTITKVIDRTYPDDPSLAGAVSPDCMNPFDGCTNLEYIEVDEENPSFCSFDGILFSKDKTELYCYPAGAKRDTYIVPDGVTFIGGDAFAYNYYLVNINMPNSVNHLGFGVFSNCKNLRSVTLSKGIRIIAASTFERCESMTFLDIPENVTNFAESVFRWTHFEKLIIRGIFPDGLRRDTFDCMDDATILYVQQSEIEKFKRVFSGTVLPLEEYVSNINHITSNQATKTIYDLQGRRLSEKPAKGIYIQNGKKIVK